MCVCVFQAAEEGGETVACYSVCVSLVEGEETANSRWSVQRKLTEFQMLHRKLTEVTQHQSTTCIGAFFVALHLPHMCGSGEEAPSTGLQRNNTLH